MLQIRQLSEVITGAATVADFPSAEERYIHQHPDLLAWIRPSTNLEENRIVDRSRGLSFNKLPRSRFPSVAPSGALNDRPVFMFDEWASAGANLREMRSGIDFLPASGAFTFVVVASWKDYGTEQRMIGSDGSTSNETFGISIDQSSKRIELKLSAASNVTATTGSGAFTATSEVPFMAIVGYDPDATRMRVRVNRGASDQTANSVGVGGISHAGDRRRLQIGASGGNDFGATQAFYDGMIGDVLAFQGYAFNDAALITAIDNVVGDYYGFAAP